MQLFSPRHADRESTGALQATGGPHRPALQPLANTYHGTAASMRDGAESSASFRSSTSSLFSDVHTGGSGVQVHPPLQRGGSDRPFLGSRRRVHDAMPNRPPGRPDGPSHRRHRLSQSSLSSAGSTSASHNLQPVLETATLAAADATRRAPAPQALQRPALTPVGLERVRHSEDDVLGRFVGQAHAKGDEVRRALPTNPRQALPRPQLHSDGLPSMRGSRRQHPLLPAMPVDAHPGAFGARPTSPPPWSTQSRSAVSPLIPSRHARSPLVPRSPLTPRSPYQGRARGAMVLRRPASPDRDGDFQEPRPPPQRGSMPRSPITMQHHGRRLHVAGASGGFHPSPPDASSGLGHGDALDSALLHGHGSRQGKRVSDASEICAMWCRHRYWPACARACVCVGGRLTMLRVHVPCLQYRRQHSQALRVLHEDDE